MIDINLLPIKNTKTKDNIIKQIVLISIIFVFFLILTSIICLYEKTKLKNTNEQIDKTNIELNKVKKKIGKLNDIEKMKKEIEKKLNVLKQLRENKVGPVNRLTFLSKNTNDNMWLDNYKENNNSVKIGGVANSDDAIAVFMKSLLASTDYVNTELIVSEQKDISGTKYKRFDLTTNIKTKIVIEETIQEKNKKK